MVQYLYGNKTDCEIVEQAEHELHSILESNYKVPELITNWHHVVQSQTDDDWLIRVDYVLEGEKRSQLDNANEVEIAINNLTHSETKPDKFEPPKTEI
jgi:hypothetical protein